MTRYKVLASDDEQLHQVEDLVAGKTRVYGTSELFRFVTTGDLSPELQDRLRALGARVVPDAQYALERAPDARLPFSRGTRSAPGPAPGIDDGTVLPPVRFRVTARDAAHLQAVRERIQGRAAIVATDPGLVIRTGMLSEALERELRDLGAAVAAVPGAESANGAADRAKQALLERLRSQPPLGIPWSREDVYDDIGGPAL